MLFPQRVQTRPSELLRHLLHPGARNEGIVLESPSLRSSLGERSDHGPVLPLEELEQPSPAADLFEKREQSEMAKLDSYLALADTAARIAQVEG